jgi:hypothetical protein
MLIFDPTEEGEHPNYKDSSRIIEDVFAGEVQDEPVIMVL